MSKPKHTPGPWTVETYHDSMFKICKPDFKIGDEVTHRLEADRRLIAAAPEALVSMENTLVLLAQLQDLSPRDIGTIEQIRESLIYVIAKAKGGAK